MNHKDLQTVLDAVKYHVEQTRPIERTSQTIAIIKAELDKPDEPVAWMYDFHADYDEIAKDWLSHDYEESHSPTMGCHNIRPLYTRPQSCECCKEQVQWGVDWGKHGDRTAVSIVKHHPDGWLEVVAMEVEPIPGFRDAPPAPVLNPMCQWPFSNKGMP
jgi:hypothetical protein